VETAVGASKLIRLRKTEKDTLTAEVVVRNQQLDLDQLGGSEGGEAAICEVGDEWRERGISPLLG
jgi:hypothetical protein